MKVVIILLSILIIGCKDTESVKKTKETRLSPSELRAIQFTQDSTYLSQFKSYTVNKLSGKHTYGGSTKVEYKSMFDILKEREKDYKKELLSASEIMEKRKFNANYYRGGQITLDIKRSTIGGANTDNFTIVVKSQNDKEILRKKLKRKTPEAPIGDRMWWNLDFVVIPELVNFPFKVYIIDALNDEPFEYELFAD